MTSANVREEVIVAMEELYRVFKLFNRQSRGEDEEKDIGKLLDEIIRRLNKIRGFFS